MGQVIRPALERGDIVISDRYAESTLAYQGYGRGLDLDALRHDYGLCHRRPQARPGHLPRPGGRRSAWSANAATSDQGLGEWNRMDQQSLDFHRRVREGYLTMAGQEPERWLVIDATQPIEANPPADLASHPEPGYNQPIEPIVPTFGNLVLSL